MQVLFIQIQPYFATTCFDVIHVIAKELHQELRQITQVLQLYYIVLTVYVQHGGCTNLQHCNCKRIVFVMSLPLITVAELSVGTVVLHSAGAHGSTVHSVSVHSRQCITICAQVDTGTQP
jgi:hypothetical protein